MQAAAISADSPLTVQAAVGVARQGGNAVDIAVSAALTATVAEVLSCSLAGSAFVMIHLPGGVTELIDGADAMPTVERIPGRESPAWRRVRLPYGEGIEVMAGPASVAVPGMPAAMELAWRRHGSLPWREIAAPALALARGRVPVDATIEKWLQVAGRALFWQQEASRSVFFPDGKQPLRRGQWFRVPRLDWTWERLASEGLRALYDGELAEKFVEDLQAEGGLVQHRDLADYRALVRQPLRMESGGFELALNPPPAVGGAAVGSLIGLLDMGWSAMARPEDQAWLQARAQAYLLGLREQTLSDPRFDREAAQRLLAEPTLRAQWHAWRSPNTTHLSVATADGGLVAITMSTGYGAGVLLPQLGIFCNNSLGEPELNPAGYHQAAAGKRLVSNMAPTVAWSPDGRAVALGSPGASRITTSIAQTWAHYALEGLDFQAAVDAPRLHIEPTAEGPLLQFEPGIVADRLAGDFRLRPFADRDMYFGAVKLAGRDAAGRLHAVADRRRTGAAVVVD